MSIRHKASTDADQALRQPEPLVSGRRLLLMLALILLLAAGEVVVTVLLVNVVNPAWKASVDFVVLVTALVYAAILAGILLAFGGWSGVRDRLAFRFTGGRDLGFALLVLALTLSGATLIYLLLSPLIGPLPQTLLSIFRTNTDLPRLPTASVLALVLIVIRAPFLAPLAEELLFRGALYGWVRRRMTALPSILLISVLFTAVFLLISSSRSLWWLTLPIVLLGNLTFTWVRERTRSTFNSFVMHMTYEACRLAVAFVLVSQHIR
jgi:membrane protease YdiL (CAAX protease family)